LKNSAETKSDSDDSVSDTSGSAKSGFSLFSIDEHRLSLGLLILVLTSAAGYGCWLAISPLLPASATAATVSRKELANSHFDSEKWNDAISIYRQMLEDDPDNGFVIEKIATARERQLFEKWQELENVGSTTGNSSAYDEIRDAEAMLFEAAITRWSGLLDNSRFQRRAYIQLASLHSFRSKVIDDPKEVEKAIDVLKKMFGNGIATRMGIGNMKSFEPLRNHPEFKRLVEDEESHSNFRSPIVLPGLSL